MDRTELQDALMTRWEKLKKAKLAYKSARFYVWIGLTAGFLLLLAQRSLHWTARWLPTTRSNLDHPDLINATVWIATAFAFILEHLGIGFIVAAIAVFFYEWGAHIKETVDLSSRLSSSIEHTKEMMNAIRMNERLSELNVKRAEERLGYCLDTLIGGASNSGAEKPKYLTDAICNCKNLILALASLQSHDTWGREQYVTFISNQIEKVVGQNAEAFSKLYEKKGEQHFTFPPTAAQMADEILALQMHSLNTDGKYDVISDLPSWMGNQLSLLNRATKAAIEEHGVQCRRVFNLIRGTPKGTKQQLLRHLQSSEQWRGKGANGGYEVRILSVAGYEKLKARGYPSKRIVDAHFGIFIKGKNFVRFKVTEADLSDMELTMDPNSIAQATELFEAVWRVAEQFPSGERTNEQARERLDQILNDLEEWHEQS
jgi:hypothetical protein